jgi:amino acid transporter
MPLFDHSHNSLMMISYMMVFLFPVLVLGYKIVKKTKRVKAHEADLITDLAEIEEYHHNFIEKPETNPFNRVLDRLFG